MAGAVINVSGTFTNTLDLTPKMPQTDYLLVYASASAVSGNTVKNQGTLGDGRIIGSVNISNGILKPANNRSSVRFTPETADSDGYYFPLSSNGGVTIAAYTKNMQPGIIGGSLIVGDESNPDDSNLSRLLTVNNLGAGEDVTTDASVGLRVGAGGGIAGGVTGHQGEEAVFITTSNPDIGVISLVMRPDGSYQFGTVNSNSYAYKSVRKGSIDWGGMNYRSAYVNESSAFAFWGTGLTQDEMLQAARAMLGITVL